MTSETVDLNNAQRQAAEALQGPVLVVAGAGTGKTSVIVERIARLIENGTSPKRLLALTFTEKAAAEMLDRVNEQRGTYELELPIMTFNAYGASLLRQYAADIGLGHNFTLLGESAQIVFLRERIDELSLDYYAPLSRPDSLLGDIAGYFSQLKQSVITPEQYHKYVIALPAADPAEKLNKKKHQELATAYETYLRLCREANAIDYDDQIYLCIELLAKRPNILAEVREAYDYIMVDEFQDTNTMQSVLVDMIVNKQQNLFVVGDDDQSIYGWRGATLANILDFKQRYPKAKDITLIQNYRSTTEILDSAYKLITHNNPHRLEERLHINKKLVGDKQGKAPLVYNFATIDEELQWISEDIKERVAGGTKPGDIAVLARRNVTVQRLHDYLDYLEVEHVVIGQRYELYHEPIVRTLLEAIKATVDPLDNMSLYHTLTGPLFSLPAQNLSQIAAMARRQHLSLQEAVEASTGEGIEEIKAALLQINEWCTKSTLLTVGKLAYEIIDSTGYKDKLYGAAQHEPESAVALTRLSDLFQTMKEFEQIALQPSALQYVDSLPALQAAGDGGEDGTGDLSTERVNILSVHKAKGLEWPVVYIVDCTEGSFPLRENARGIALPADLRPNSATEADSHIAEERRLMYVAMTRARDELIMTHAERHTTATTRKPSRFLAEAFGDQVFAVRQPTGAMGIGSVGGFGANNIAVDVPIPKYILDGERISLSVSQVSKYLDCPLDFYYCYVLNVPQESSAAMDYGTLMHSLLQDINQGLMVGKTVAFEDLATRLKAEWPKDGYLSTKHQERAFAQAQSSLKRLYEERMNGEPRVPVAVEEPFTITLPDHKLTVRGRFDAVFPLGDNVEIVDYKTSANVDTPEKAKSRASGSEQLTLYALAWQKMHDQLPALVTLDFIDTGQLGSIKKTQRGLDGAVLRLQKVAEGIRTHDFTPGKDHLFCIHPPVN